MDITCRKCGEPWDSYGLSHGDMDLLEAARFRKGEGCPSCGFGNTCTHCRGSGMEPGDSILLAHCKTCLDQHWTIVYQSSISRFGAKSAPYFHAVLGQKPRLLLGTSWSVIETYNTPTQCLDGYEWAIKITCPDCTGEPCSVCNGSRQFVPPDVEQQNKNLDNFMWSRMESSE